MAITLSQVRSAAEPPRSYNYELVIPTIPGGAFGGVGFGGGGSDILRIKTKTAQVPGFNINKIESTQHGFKHQRAGRGTFSGDFAVTYEEAGEYLIHKTLRKWYDLIWPEETGAQAAEADYKTDALLYLYGPLRREIGRIKIKGMWIQTLSEIDLDGSSDEPITINATFAYDIWRYE